MNLLDNDSYPLFFKGCLRVRQDEQGVLPLRFTDRQLAVYADPEGRQVRSLCPAGVSLDLRTDAESIRLEFDAPRGAREWMNFDLWVNGILTGHEGVQQWNENLNDIRITIPRLAKGLQQVTIYLPHCRELRLRTIELTDGAAARPVPAAERTLLCIGDSITQGMSAMYPSSMYAVQLARRLGMELLNWGVGGYIFAEESLDTELPQVPDIITVAYGTNDWGFHQDADGFRIACTDYISALADGFPHARIFILTPIWRADLHTPKPMGPFPLLAEIIREASAGRGSVSVLDGLKLTPHIPEYYTDGTVHPNDLGFMHYAANLLAGITGNP